VGQQQLLLIVLGVIIVGIAIVVGMTTFKSNAVSANREQVVSNLLHLASRAQQYYMKPSSLAGGNRNFKGFALMVVDTGNANGSFSPTATQPSGATYVAGSTAAISSSASKLYIVGCGKQNGNDPASLVKAYVAVTADSMNAQILN
jgi:Tfp pilus assembly protein PilE